MATSSQINGLFICNKSEGVSSAGFLNSIKRILKLTEPIGHGGTLDPFAEGLWIVGIGRQYTRALEYYLKGADKTYEATIILGAGSTTYDRTGIISHMPGTKTYTKEEIKNAIKEIKARPEQMPPPVSAKKIGGIPAYRLVRQGKPFQLRPQQAALREYEIRSVETVENLTKLEIKLRVSSGFYIRSFAHDLGELLGTDGYVEYLVRAEIGFFKLPEALSLQDLQGDIELVYRSKGTVQDVGFRAFAKSLADQMHIHGHARNTKEGVEIIGQGTVARLSEFLEQIKKGPKGAVVEVWQDYFRKIAEKKEGFEIIKKEE